MKIEDAFEDQIGFGKSVRVADRPETDIFRRPQADPFGFKKCLAKVRRILCIGKRDHSAQHPPAEFSNRLPAGARRLDGA